MQTLLFKGSKLLNRFGKESFNSLQHLSKRRFAQEVSFLQLRNNMNKVQHNETMMRVKDEDLRLLTDDENKKQPIIKNFFTSMNEDYNIKIFEHKNIKSEDKSISYPRNSYYKVVFPLEKNIQIRDRFTNYFSDGLRIGRILEILDYMAAYISYRHCYSDIGTRIVTNVTACVDNMNFYSQMRNDQDLEVQGYITYAGQSSMEIQLDMFQHGDLKASSIFLMVARDANDKSKSYKIPTLNFEGEDDSMKCQVREHLGTKHMIQRKKEKVESLYNKPPSSQEILDIHQFFADKQKYLVEQQDNTSAQLSSTTFDKNLLMHKQDRNLHGNIFGGHLVNLNKSFIPIIYCFQNIGQMREAMEMGWLAALIHAKGDYPLTYNIDDFQFVKPVPVGSILNFEAKIGYVIKNIMQVVVNCSIVDTNKCKVKSNDLHITLVAPKTAQLQKVIPHSYEEAMIYLDCKRRLDNLIK